MIEWMVLYTLIERERIGVSQVSMDMKEGEISNKNKWINICQEINL